eukprot:12409329-Karenia_brevis.AAC.1
MAASQKPDKGTFDGVTLQVFGGYIPPITYLCNLLPVYMVMLIMMMMVMMMTMMVMTMMMM